MKNKWYLVYQVVETLVNASDKTKAEVISCRMINDIHGSRQVISHVVTIEDK